MKFIFISFLFPLQLFAQDITGVWAGSLYNDTSKEYIHYELAISDFNGKLSGYSHTTYVIDNFKNIGVKTVKIKKKEDEFFVEDEKLIDNNYAEPADKGVKTFIRLAHSENDSAEVLSGTWNTNQTKIYSKLTGTVFLEKKKEIKKTLIVSKLEQMGLSNKLSFVHSGDLVVINSKQSSPKKIIQKPRESGVVINEQQKIIKNEPIEIPAAAEIATRKIETIRTVEIISRDSLVFTLYDDGTVDGDTVSVLINGKVIWPRVGLLATAKNKTIYLTPEMGDSIYVVMYAENLGSIPPNTGLLVVRDGDKDYEIRFTGDLHNNSAIILKRKKKE